MTGERKHTSAEAKTAFAAFAAEVRVAVDRELVRILDEEADRTRLDGESVTQVLSAVRSITMRGGKRLRPALLGAAFVAAGGSGASSEVAVAGAALELLQTYLLIHDDWMDASALRRGGPSAHVLLGQAFGQAAGAAGAIMAGDYASSLAQRVFFDVPAKADRLLAAARVLGTVHSEVVRGQTLDMFGRVNQVDGVESLYALKTGSYTVAGPLAIGAVLAGGADLAPALEKIGSGLGVAFQLQDDLLGLFGSEATTGKPVGADLRDGKRTWIIAQLGNDAHEKLTPVFGRPDASASAVENALDVLRHHPATSACRQRIAQLSARARSDIEALPIAPHGKELLLGAIHLLTERDA